MPNVRISDLPPATLPLAGTEILEITQQDLSRKVAVTDISSALGLDASFVTVTPNAVLPNERLLTAGTGISIVDSGPGLPITVAATSGGLSGLGEWRARTETVTPPASGQIRFNNADPELATELYISETNDGSTDVGAFLALLTAGSLIYIQEKADSANFILVEVGSNTDSGTFVTIGIANIIQQGAALSQNTRVILVINISGGVSTNVVAGTVDGQQLIWDVGNNQYEPVNDAILRINPAAPPTSPLGRISAAGFNTTDVRKSFIHMNVGASVGTVWSTDRNGGTPAGFYGRSSFNFSPEHDWGYWESPGSQTGVPIFSITDDLEFIFKLSSFYDERAAALASVAARGQLWVRNDVPNVLVYTNDAGTDFDLNGILPVGTVDGAGLFWDVGNTAWEERPQFTYEEQVDLGNGTGNWLTITNSVANRTGIRLLVPGIEDFTIYADDTDFTTHIVTQAIEVSAPSGTNFLHTLRAVQLANNYIELGASGPNKQISTGSLGGDLQILAGNGSDDLVLVFGTSLFMEEKTTARASTAARGQFWVRDDIPNVPVFTDDAGTDFVLNTPAGDVFKVGTPVDNQVGVWTGDGTLEGTANFTYDNGTKTFGLGAGSTFFTGSSTYFFQDGNLSLDGESTIIPVISIIQGGINNQSLALTPTAMTFGHGAGGLVFNVSGNLARWEFETAVRVTNASGTDWIEQDHDGTDYNLTAVNTADINITGLSGRILQGAETLAFVSELPVLNDAVQARRTTGYVLTTAFVDVTLDTTDVETDAAVLNHDLVTNTDNIIAVVAGTYKISYQFDIINSSVVNTIIEAEARVRLNDAGTGIPGSLAGTMNMRNHGTQLPTHLTCDFIVTLAATDFITLQVQKIELDDSQTYTINEVSVKATRLL